MNRAESKKEFLDVKYNELNLSFNEYKKEDFYLSRFNSINKLNQNNKISVVSSMLNDTKYQLSLMVLTQILNEMSDDFSCKYIAIILNNLWEQYCSILKLNTKMRLVLIDYKNGDLDVKTAYKKYNDIKDLILKEQAKTIKKYKNFDELLNLCNDKEKIYGLAEKFLKILEIDTTLLNNMREIFKELPSVSFDRKVVKHKKELKDLFDNCEEFASVIPQIQHNITEININMKTK